ncbi:hypothetical protein N665_1773s0001 [Sinapis alba]|nr:hypothetical protein N665_1773s0001 [Sinapis alba]
MFGDGVGTFSSGGPSSSGAVHDSQTSQRVSWSPPPPAPLIPSQMPPPPPPAAPPAALDQPAPAAVVHPDLRAPPSAPYARYTGLDILNPDKPRILIGKFRANNRVGWNVLETIKGYYDGAYPN